MGILFEISKKCVIFNFLSFINQLIFYQSAVHVNMNFDKGVPKLFLLRC